MEPNKERLRLWAAALRSGEWERCEGQLGIARTPRRCCLGVACEVAVRHGASVSFDMMRGELPLLICEWYGLKALDPTLDGASATDWNDREHLTFPEIAKLIEKEYGL